MISSHIDKINSVKYICRSFSISERYIYRKFAYVTTFHSYDRYSMRERMRKPFFKDNEKGDNIALYANKLARNSNFEPEIWDKVVAKSKETYMDMKPMDIALLLNSLSRARVYDSELFELLVPQIIQKISFFTSVYISMVLSAYSKGKLLTPELYKVFKHEISNRLYEFTTSIEMCMIMNAISKFGESDKLFLNKICNHMIKMFGNFHFTPQELSVIINSFVSLGYYNEHLFNSFSKILVNYLGSCSLYELTRILSGFFIFENNSNDIQSRCREEIIRKIRYAPQTELTGTLYTLGNIHHTALKSNIDLNGPVIEEIVSAIKQRSLKVIGSFTVSSLSYFLISLSKWSFKLESDELNRVLEQLTRVKMDLSLGEINNTVVAITKLFCNSGGIQDANDIRNIQEGDGTLGLVQTLLKVWLPRIMEVLEREKVELGVLIKILETYNRFGVYDDMLFSKVKSIIVVNHLNDLNRNNGYTLYEIFNKHKGYTKYDDFTEILSELIS